MTLISLLFIQLPRAAAAAAAAGELHVRHRLLTGVTRHERACPTYERWRITSCGRVISEKARRLIRQTGQYVCIGPELYMLVPP